MQQRSKARVGAVSYLNTKPLIYRLTELSPHIELVLDLPSRLADGLAEGTLDVALVPSIEYFKDPAYKVISDACIACRGPVMSVKLFSRVPADEIQTLALDEGSRTSVVLTRILLKERFEVEPQMVPLPIGASIAAVDSDAVLVIGDRAMHAPGEPFAEVWDLGDEWCRWTGLPFVFAMWVARPGFVVTELATALASARDIGLANLDAIAAEEAAALGLSRPQCVSYLRDNLYFYLGEEERRGLDHFQTLAQKLDAVGVSR
jgi:chorismate dehydratase